MPTKEQPITTMSNDSKEDEYFCKKGSMLN